MKETKEQPIFIAQKRFSKGLPCVLSIFAIVCLLCYHIKNLELNNEKLMLFWFIFTFFVLSGTLLLYTTIFFKKIVFFDDIMEICFSNKIITIKYDEIKNYEILTFHFIVYLKINCKPRLGYLNYLSSIFLYKKDIYKIEEILAKKGVKDNSLKNQNYYFIAIIVVLLIIYILRKL